MASNYKIPENVYNSYKETREKLEVIENKIEDINAIDKHKLTYEMPGASGYRPISMISEHKSLLEFAHDKMKTELDTSLRNHLTENKIPSAEHAEIIDNVADRYEKEREKSLDQSQEYSLGKLSEKNKENWMDKTQDNFSTAINTFKSQEQSIRNSKEMKDNLSQYDVTLNLSFNMMEKKLEDKTNDEKNREKDIDKD